MKLKEFIDIVTDRSSSTGRIGPVPLDLTRGELAELRAECSFLGWNPIPPISMPEMGDTFDFGPARITLVEDASAPRSPVWWHIHPSDKPLAYVINRVNLHVDLDSRIHGGDPEKIEITKTPKGWEAIGYGKPRNTGAVEAGVAEEQEQAELLTEAAKRVAMSAEGECVSVGAIDEDTAKRIGEKVKDARYFHLDTEAPLPGTGVEHGGDDEEVDVWESLREQTVAAIDEGRISDAMRLLELAEKLSGSDTRLGFHG